MILSVTQFVAYLNETFKAIWDSTEVAIEGEVSGYRVSQGQWVNFDVKDDESLVSCFCVLAKMPMRLEDGMRVRLYGMPRVYPKYGKFSLSVDRVELVGEGALKKALAALRARLEAEGLFDSGRKRSLPRFPQKIALVASTESAAYGDFIRIVSERWGGLEIDAYHVLVQGEKAPASIVRAFEMIREKGGVYDAVVLTRGGGSFEELMAFNDERVVRALYACPVPTLVGIGHERDLSLAEEVADVRGSTPTDCARRLVPDRRDVLYELASMHEGMIIALERRLETMRYQQTRLQTAIERWNERSRSLLQERAERLSRVAELWIRGVREGLERCSLLLEAVNPERVLQRGYALILDPVTGAPLTRVESLKGKAAIQVRLQDGAVHATLGTSIEQLSLLYGQKET